MSVGSIHAPLARRFVKHVYRHSHLPRAKLHTCKFDVQSVILHDAPHFKVSPQI